MLGLAAVAGLPEAQRDPGRLAAHPTAQIGREATPIRETVRKLTRVEMLARSGVLEPHEAAACEKYAEWHALGFDTIGCTANYEGASGGGFGAGDLLARYKAQRDAREDYAFARGFIPAPYVQLFEAIVCRNETLSGVAGEAFAQLKRSQAENKVRLALKLCANLLHGGIRALLPIEPPPPIVRERIAKAPAPEASSTPVALHALTDAIAAALDRAESDGTVVAEIHVARATADALCREAGGEADDEVASIRGVPVVIRDSWGWGYLIVSAGALDIDRQNS